MNFGKLLSCFLIVLAVSSCRKTKEPCNSKNPAEDFPWLVTHLDSIDVDPCNIEAHVFDYRGNHSVYVRGCSELDESSFLFDCSGTVMCEFNIFGNINTCTDFENASEYVGQVYP